MLIKLAAIIASQRNYELECLQVILIPRSQAPAEATVRSTKSRRLLKQAEQLAQSYGIPVHTQVRLAHDSAHAILEVIKERHVDLILMGWKGTTSTPGRIFGNVVDTLIRQAACEVILVKLQQGASFSRWLVPMAGGPNAQQALRLLPALIQLSEAADIKVCQVFQQQPSLEELTQLQQTVTQLETQLACSVEACPTWGYSVPEAVLQLATHKSCDVIMLGASREGLLQQVIKGNIPEAITRESLCSVILVRGAITS
jgi:CIC family chloride channel protein